MEGRLHAGLLAESGGTVPQPRRTARLQVTCTCLRAARKR